jgi:hypothetical protein
MIKKVTIANEHFFKIMITWKKNFESEKNELKKYKKINSSQPKVAW